MYLLASTRGYKTLVKHFPHEVADLEPTVHMLLSQDASDHSYVSAIRTSQRLADVCSNWETRYILLLWLSILVLVPFDLNTIDSSQSTAMSSGDAQGSLINTIVDECKRYLAEPSRMREAAGLCLAKLLTR